MSKVQTRRSISFAIADFEAAQRLAAHLKIPLAQLAGQALREFVARTPDPGPPPGKPAKARPAVRVDRGQSPPPSAPIAMPTIPLSGVAPRKKPEPFNLKAVHRAVDVLSKPENQAPVDGEGNVVINVEHGRPIRRAEAPATWAEISGTPIDKLIDRSSVGAGLRNIQENGIDAELEDLEQEMADHPDAGDIRVVYDEEL